MGTGMAFPWKVICQAPLANDKLTEDLQLGIDLAISGHPPVFCSVVKVTSGWPSRNDAFVSQRKRWEHGSLRTAISQLPRLLIQASCQRKPSLACIGFDLGVPPLSLLAMTWMVTTITMTVLWLFGASGWPAGMLAAGGLAMITAIFVGWAVYCRHVISWTALVMVPVYVLRKIPIYFSFFLMKHQQEWVRTQREISDTMPAN
jgi:cellulose synthase/poly-beta-1,6-N-acetylglucosamine synthase-like glycosyltransferase